jgi:hypothetical protein
MASCYADEVAKLEAENEELETNLSLAISMYEGEDSPMAKLEQEKAQLEAENAVLEDYKRLTEPRLDLWSADYHKLKAENEGWKRRTLYLAKWVEKATKESMGNIMEATDDYADALLTDETS